MAVTSNNSQAWRVWLVGTLAIALGIIVYTLYREKPPEGGVIPYFTIPVGQVRTPLPYRIVSFHRGRANKNLIKLASQLGFNGVQIQIEGSNEGGIEDFAARDAEEHLIDYCHSLGMKVTVWVHEISDLPDELSPDYLGEVSIDNAALWKLLDDRYEWILGEAIPKADGLVLTTVETQVNATATPIMLKLVDLIDRKCRDHGKSLIVRTFVWHPDELDNVMAAVKQMPHDIVMMSKIVCQDWQMRGGYSAELGAVGNRPQIVEFDVAGEYFLKNNVANCMVELLHRQFDYAVAAKAQGICVRVDRDVSNVLFEPQEVNLWALGMLASGASNSDNDIWQRWAAYRYGSQAAPGILKTLQPTSEVVAEMLSVGPFTLADTRAFPPLPNEDVFSQNWQNWRWNPEKFTPDLLKAQRGEAGFVEALTKQKSAAMALADKSIADLQSLQTLLPPREYQILHTRLLSNKVQLAFRTIVVMSVMHFRQAVFAETQSAFDTAIRLFKQDIQEAHKLSADVKNYPTPTNLAYLGKNWALNAPLGITSEQIADWADAADEMIR